MEASSCVVVLTLLLTHFETELWCVITIIIGRACIRDWHASEKTHTQGTTALEYSRGVVFMPNTPGFCHAERGFLTHLYVHTLCSIRTRLHLLVLAVHLVAFPCVCLGCVSCVFAW